MKRSNLDLKNKSIEPEEGSSSNTKTQNGYYSTANASKTSILTGAYVKRRDDKSNKRGTMLNKLQPIRAYSRYTDDVKSVKRTAGFSKDREILSPYIDTRETSNAVNMSKIRETRLIKNAETDIISDQDESSKETEQPAVKPMNPIYNQVKAKQGAIMNQLQQARWKSTLQRPQPGVKFYCHKKESNQDFSQVPPNAISSQLKSSKVTAGSVNSRSASFQPSIIRRREGNKIKNVDLEQEMIKNIQNRRKGTVLI